MATALSEADQANMLELFKSFAAKDAPAMADATLAFSGPSQSCPDPVAFRNHVQVGPGLPFHDPPGQPVDLIEGAPSAFLPS